MSRGPERILSMGSGGDREKELSKSIAMCDNCYLLKVSLNGGFLGSVAHSRPT